METIDSQVSGQDVHSDIEALISYDDYLTEMGMEVMRKKGRNGNSADFYHEGMHPAIPKTEVYERQLRMATQIAEALSSVTSPVDPQYTRAARVLASLEKDMKTHGSGLFGNRSLATQFVIHALEAVYTRIPTKIQITTINERPSYTIN